VNEDCYNAALRLLSRREHACSELRVKLKQRGFGSECIEPVLTRLTESGFQSDERYKYVIIRHLISRGYGSKYIKSYVEEKKLVVESHEIELGYESHGLTEEDVLTRQLPKHIRDQREYDRAMRKLIRRGYGYREIKSVLDHLRPNDGASLD